MKWGVLVVAGLSVVLIAYVSGQRSTWNTQTYQARVDTVRLTEAARVVAGETVKVVLRAKARVDTLVSVLTDTQIVVRATPSSPPETVRVAPVVVERLVTDDRTILSLRGLLHADTLAFAALNALLATPKPVKHWGLGATVGYGCGRENCGPTVTAGLTWKW